jgi:hypothetical protein
MLAIVFAENAAFGGIRLAGRQRSQQTVKLCLPAFALHCCQNRNQKLCGIDKTQGLPG